MTRSSRAAYVLGALGVLGAATLPTATGAQNTADRLDREAIEAVVAAVYETIEANYVFEDIAARYVAGLAERSGGYATEMSPSDLAARITADLQAIHPDKHLRLLPSAPASPSRGGRQGGVQAAGNTPAPPPRVATPDQLYTPLDLSALPDIGRRLFADEVKRNHFFRSVEVLSGNIGYLDYDQFGFPNFSTQAADAAFGFLAETDAIIIDLRGNPGGVEGMNQYLATHFFGEEPVHLYSRYYGVSRTTLEYTTHPDRVQRRFPDLPLFILVDSGTGSAAENFSFAMQGLGRATVVGEASAGAAHSSRAFEVAPGFLLQLPIARAYNPRTDEDWEGTGVIPDIETTSESALDVAHGAAVDRLRVGASPDERLALEDARLLMAARSSPSVDPSSFGDYEGNFGGRRVYVEDGDLRMVRTDVGGAAPVDLVPLAPDYFTLRQAAVARIRFERDPTSGDVVRLHVRLPTGVWDVSDRSGG